MASLMPEEIVRWCLARKPYTLEVMKAAMMRRDPENKGRAGLLAELFLNLDTVTFYLMEYTGRFAAEADNEKARAALVEMADLAGHLEKGLDGMAKLLPSFLYGLDDEAETMEGEGDAETGNLTQDRYNKDETLGRLRMSDIRERLPFADLCQAMLVPMQRRIEGLLTELNAEEQGLLGYQLADSLPSLAIFRFCLGFLPANAQDIPMSERVLFETLLYEGMEVILKTRLKGEPFDGKGILNLLGKVVSKKG